jgi:hypothetical protein
VQQLGGFNCGWNANTRNFFADRTATYLLSGESASVAFDFAESSLADGGFRKFGRNVVSQALR